jgi:hypothetical protein
MPHRESCQTGWMCPITVAPLAHIPYGQLSAFRFRLMSQFSDFMWERHPADIGFPKKPYFRGMMPLPQPVNNEETGIVIAIEIGLGAVTWLRFSIPIASLHPEN